MFNPHRRGMSQPAKSIISILLCVILFYLPLFSIRSVRAVPSPTRLITDYAVNIGELGEHAPGGILIKFRPTEYAGYVIQRYAESHRVLKGQSGIV
ncbi:MAG: hypothetical protein AB7H86_23300, partial [Blastocatellales bacterium]